MARRSRPLTCSMLLQGKPIRSSISSFVNPSPKTPSSPATWTRSLTCAICWRKDTSPSWARTAGRFTWCSQHGRFGVEWRSRSEVWSLAPGQVSSLLETITNYVAAGALTPGDCRAKLKTKAYLRALSLPPLLLRRRAGGLRRAVEDGLIDETEESSGFIRNGLGGIIHRARLMLPREFSLCLQRGVLLGFRLNVCEQDFAGDTGGHQEKAGFAVIECGVERVAVVQFRSAALESADDGISGFLVECDPANHRSNPCQPHWPCDLAILA